MATFLETNVMDQLFKMYYSPFSDRGMQGAKAGMIGMSVTISLNEFMLLIYLISFFQKMKAMGPIFIIGLPMLLIALNFYYIENKYIKSNRFEALSPNPRFIYAIFMLIHFFLTTISLPIVMYLAW
jgi:uncharacterized membrane protein YozB (DUF420 family)